MNPAHITPLSNCREYILCKCNANENSYVNQSNLIESSLRVQTRHGPVKTSPLLDIRQRNRETIKQPWHGSIAVNIPSMEVTRGKAWLTYLPYHLCLLCISKYSTHLQQATSSYINNEQHVPFLLLLTQVVTVSPLLPSSCTCSLHIKDRWEWALISHVRQPTLATLQTYNDSCWAHIQRELSVQLIARTNCWKAGREKSKKVFTSIWVQGSVLVCLLSSTKANGGEKRKREWEKEREGRSAKREEIGFFRLVFVVALAVCCSLVFAVWLFPRQPLYVSLS